MLRYSIIRSVLTVTVLNKIITLTGTDLIHLLSFSSSEGNILENYRSAKWISPGKLNPLLTRPNLILEFLKSNKNYPWSILIQSWKRVDVEIVPRILILEYNMRTYESTLTRENKFPVSTLFIWLGTKQIYLHNTIRPNMFDLENHHYRLINSHTKFEHIRIVNMT